MTMERGYRGSARTRGRRSIACVAAVLALAAAPGGLVGQETGDGASASPGGDEPDAEQAEAEAVAVIHALFDAMRASDAEAIRTLFADGVQGFPSSAVGLDGAAIIEFGDLDGFLETVAAAEPGSLDEQIVVRDVIVDDNLVTIVTPYTFTYAGELSHCGVDVFLIARSGDDWKIAGLADTRRMTGCEGWLDEARNGAGDE